MRDQDEPDSDQGAEPDQGAERDQAAVARDQAAVARDQAGVARAIGLRLLTGAPRSRAELAAAMARKDVPEEVADAVLDRFTEVGLVDDAEYAQMLVRSRHADRGLARRALSVELRRKGIGEEFAAAALATIDADDEEATARDLARRRLRGMGGLAPDVQLRRVVATLGRKGYPMGLAVRIVREVMDDEHSAGDVDRQAGPARAPHPDDEWTLDGS
ncbi:regulatory protein RecX [Pengzhenrongella sicca]|uniref:Regulatory protein RecX n=1 Tax=Pengzhenrongella sicca TaxID=2819238 RepID=A0A8A4ZF41_9MICO|nr:regulatory protein RecX [Pengzhenrongella sicca]QTE30612.1 regulatory protein RecX [Pengzhenrongella sicca]